MIIENMELIIYYIRIEYDYVIIKFTLRAELTNDGYDYRSQT